MIPLAPTFTSVGGIYKSVQGFNGGISYRYIKDRPANEDNSIVAKGYFCSMLRSTIPGHVESRPGAGKYFQYQLE